MSKRKKKKQKWQLDPKDIGIYVGSSHSCKGKARHSRVLDVTDCRMTLKHNSTSLSVSGEIEDGHYSKREMRDLKKRLYESLFKELELLVAGALRIPGR